jgi:hypothetical protein
MGYEYLIAVRRPRDDKMTSLLESLENPLAEGGWPSFDAKITERGIYFCDHARSPAAAIAFRRIVDAALLQSESVEISEP